MTHANIERQKHTPWFAKAGAACSIVPLSRFVGPNIFALKGGGYGCLFSLSGIDEEGLTDLDLDSQMRSIEGALRGLPEPCQSWRAKAHPHRRDLLFNEEQATP
jgi:type IV secretion system protein VirB4